MDDSATVAELIRNEHPQIIATILVHLDRDQASEILSLLIERLRNDVLVAHRHPRRHPALGAARAERCADQAAIGQQQPQEESMAGCARPPRYSTSCPATWKAESSKASRSTTPNWRRRSGRDVRVREHHRHRRPRHPAAAARNPVGVLDRRAQGFLRDLREKIFKNMSQRAAEMLRDDLEAKGPVRVSEVESDRRKS